MEILERLLLDVERYQRQVKSLSVSYKTSDKS